MKPTSLKAHLTVLWTKAEEQFLMQYRVLSIRNSIMDA